MEVTEAQAKDLLDRYSDMVLRIALHNVRSRSDAEDIAQEVFLRRITARRPFASPEHEKAWMIRVTINRCRDFLKSARRKAVPLEEVPDKPCHAEVLEAVWSLPVPYRNAVYLHYYEGFSVKEIAHLLHRRENTVSSWLHRARAALKDLLKGGFDDE
ncbi:MAG: sigma-70 family RNA polymerase sigma factor [Oscillospiraceae bacterium]|jgi:RNA polymerase sigma-70 factor (ECF subfamily)|nr:sigma-70 family RNA polymerase sigma factor [Oscillospiraceae bacterium]